MTERAYFEQFVGDIENSELNRPGFFEVIRHGDIFLLVDDQKTVYMNGQPFGMIHNALFEHGHFMPHSESEAWAQLPDYAR